MWTAEAIRVAAELKPFDKVATDSKVRNLRRLLKADKQWLKEFDRQSGRTTKLTCEAMAAALNDQKVVFLVANKDMIHRVRNTITQFATEASLNSTVQLLKLNNNIHIVSIGLGWDKVLVDNAVTD